MTARLAAVLVAALAAPAVGCGGDEGDRDRAPPGAGIGAVIKGVDNPFFATMRDGLVETARRHDVRIRVDAAADLQDTQGQASALESLAAGGAACYVVNPINRTNLLGALSHLPAATPIVNIDSPLSPTAAEAAGVKIAAYVGIDNVAAGTLAADAMAGFVPRGTRVALLTGVPGDAGSGARAAGFRRGARGRFVVTRAVAADFEPEQARLAALDLLRADPGLRGLFSVNDEMALGAARAVREAGRRGTVAILGMDGTRAALAAIERGSLTGTVAQYPFTIGQLGVEACLASMRGKAVPARIDAPVQLVTAANVARALRAFPEPAQPFDDPLAPLLRD